MANNCLQTKLKATVNNESLPIINYITLIKRGTDNVVQRLNATKTLKSSHPFDVYNDDSCTDLVVSGVTGYFHDRPSINYAPVYCKLSIPGTYYYGNKYEANGVCVFSNVVLDLDTCNFISLNVYDFKNTKGTLFAKTMNEIFSFDKHSSVIPDEVGTIDFDDYHGGSVYIHCSAESLNIKNLDITTLTRDTSSDGYYNIEINGQGDGIYGEITTWLDGLYNNGKTSGNVTIQMSGNAVTYNGTTGTSLKSFNFSQSGWTEA